MNWPAWIAFGFGLILGVELGVIFTCVLIARRTELLEWDEEQ